MKRVIWGRRATRQLNDALDYLGERNVVAAAKLETQILAAVENLAVKPIGRLGKRADTFEKLVIGTPYLIIYAFPESEPDSLLVLRVFHTAQNWTAWKFDSDEMGPSSS